MKPNLSEKYHNALTSIPAPGHGCHGAIMGTANLGVIAGIALEKIHNDIARHIPHGTRRISEKEITEAIAKAAREHNKGTAYNPPPKPTPVIKDGTTALQRIINQAKITTEVDLWEASPVRLTDDPQRDPAFLLETLYKPDDLIWIGDRIQPGIIGDTIRTVREWIAYFKTGGTTAQHIIPNPLTGLPAPTKDSDKETLRGDGNVKEYRHCVVEFDDIPREDQLCFWCSAKLPICALIDSGGKSIHAWLDVKKLAIVATYEHWQSEIKGCLYDQRLIPLGVDKACSNPARLSRLPGHYRNEKQAMQRLLWLSPVGREVIP